MFVRRNKKISSMKNFLNFFNGNDKMFSVSEIKFHLESYRELYMETKKIFQVAPFDFCKSFAVKEKYPNEDLFIKQYIYLLDFCKISEKENYFEKELDYYNFHKNDTPLLKELLIKNREVCEDLIYSFIVNYEDDEKSAENSYWEVGFHEYWQESFYFKVSKGEFLKTLEFLEIFYELFWDRKVYPEAIEEIEAEIERLNVVNKNQLHFRETEENFENLVEMEDENIVLPF